MPDWLAWIFVAWPIAIAGIVVFVHAATKNDDEHDCSICNSGGGRHLPHQRKP